MSDTTEDPAAESLLPVEWPAQDGDSAASALPGATPDTTPEPPALSVDGATPGAPATPAGGGPAARAGAGALPPLLPPLPPLSSALSGPATDTPADAPAESAPQRTRLSAPPDPTTTGQPAHEGPSALDVETTRLRPASAALDAETARLKPGQPGASALDIETTLLDAKRAALNSETMRLGQSAHRPATTDAATDHTGPQRPTIPIETERLSGAILPPDAPTERLPHDQGPVSRGPVDQQETELLTREQLLAQIETERLKASQPAITDEETERLKRDQSAITDEETERLKRDLPAIDDEETERLKRAGAPATQFPPQARNAPLYTGTPDPLLTEPLEEGRYDGGYDEAGLQEEATAALAFFSPPMPAPITPETVDAASVSSPSSPGSMADVADAAGLADTAGVAVVVGPGDAARPDESLIRALRREMFPRLSLRRRLVAVFSQPDVVIMTLFALAQVGALAVYPWPDHQPGVASTLAQGARIASGDGLALALDGLRQGHGAPLWAVIATAASLLGGTVAARTLAILCVAAAGVATARAAQNLFGGRAGVFTAALFALSGPLIYIAHIATADQLALPCVAISLWAITQASETRRDEWLLAAAIAFGVAAIVSLAALELIIPLGLVALALRARPPYTVFSITGLVVVAFLVSRFLPPPESVFTFLPHRGPYGLTLSVSVSAAGLQLAALGVLAWAAAIAGWIVARGRLAAALFAGLLFDPVIIALAGGGPNAAERIVPGLLFGLPLMGVAFATLWTHGARLDIVRRGLAITLLLIFGVVGLLQVQGLTTPAQLRPAHGIHHTWGRVAAPAPPRSARAG